MFPSSFAVKFSNWILAWKLKKIAHKIANHGAMIVIWSQMYFQIEIGIAIAISISEQDWDWDWDRDLNFGDRGHALYVGMKQGGCAF